MHAELEGKNIERWKFLTALPSSCCIIKLEADVMVAFLARTFEVQLHVLFFSVKHWNAILEKVWMHWSLFTGSLGKEMRRSVRV